jgi:hypothetical protein
MTLDLKPEKAKPYLKMITDAIVADSSNKGSLRKNIWDYLLKHHSKQVDYKDFLLAIRRFIIDGKMSNNEGYFSVHPEVINEVRDKKPTPAPKKPDGKLADNPFLQIKDASSNKQKTMKIIPSMKKEKSKKLKESAR